MLTYTKLWTFPPTLISFLSSFRNSFGSDSADHLKGSKTQKIDISFRFNADSNGGVPIREFYRKLSAEILRETKELKHPVIAEFDTSRWSSSILAYYEGPKYFILEKPFVIQKYDLIGTAGLRKNVANWLDIKPNDISVGRSGHHGSVHSAFVNGSIGASVTGLYAGVYNKGLKPLPWKDPLAKITASQVLPRVLQRVSLFIILCSVGGFGVDYSSQIFEQYRRKEDALNQIIGSGVIGAAMSLLVNRRNLRRSLISAGVFSSLTYAHYRMDLHATKSKGVTNSQFYY